MPQLPLCLRKRDIATGFAPFCPRPVGKCRARRRTASRERVQNAGSGPPWRAMGCEMRGFVSSTAWHAGGGRFPEPLTESPGPSPEWAVRQRFDADGMNESGTTDHPFRAAAVERVGQAGGLDAC